MNKYFLSMMFMLCFSDILYSQTINISSPNKIVQLSFQLAENSPQYKVSFKGKPVILPSALGFTLSDGSILQKNMKIIAVDSSLIDETWQPIWGEVKNIRNYCKQLTVQLTENISPSRKLNIVFRIFDEGVGFRYEFPEQKTLDYFTIKDELTQFHLAGDHKTFWIPGDYDTNEYFYYTTPLTKIDATVGKDIHEIAVRTLFDSNAVQTPLMMKTSDGLYINIHEAALVNYPAMNLHVDKANLILESKLVPDALGNKAYLHAPCHTPWRTIIVSDKAADILASKMILNLNEPTVFKDVSWVKPQKFIGIWWGMHIGSMTWEAGPKHGATTKNTKRYIDFAAKHGIDAVLIEGWNIGWEDWFGKWKEDVFDFVTPYPDFNVPELTAYAKSKGVKLIMHHETSGAVTNYERRMDSAYRFMKQFGYDAVKTGYVGKIIPRGEHHDGQWMINHYVRVAEKTGEYKIMLDAHEPVRPTGLHRTYPNWLACEAARGNEFNAWSRGNAPEHETILPFTRLIGGPMDYTPGIFKMRPPDSEGRTTQVHTTLCKQLALYVTLYSPLQMAADLPENYEARIDAFQFIKDVAVDWDDSKILEAEPGDYVTITRKAKGKDSWFVGAITDENSRIANVDCSFLDANKKYAATIYHDANDTHWQKNPESYIIEKVIIDSKTTIKLKMAEGGGAAISIIPASAEDVKKFKKYRKLL